MKCQECGAQSERLAQNNKGDYVCTTRCILRDPTLTKRQRHTYEKQLEERESSKRAARRGKGGAAHGLATR